MTETENKQNQEQQPALPIDPVNPITGEVETRQPEPEDEPIPIPEGDDDGSLAFLQIPSDASRRQFNCPETTQQKLVNTTFWLIDFYEEIKTKYGFKMLIKVKPSKDAPESEARKFFTNCEDIKYVMRQIKRRNAFPRKVTLRANGNHYFFE
jgi:hypothetical protein